MSSRIYLSKPSKIISLQYALQENSLEDFEKLLELYFLKGIKAVALNSGTSAIHLALILSGVSKNDEVFCQNATFVATANPILYQNAIPVFLDSEKDTGNMCPNILEEAIKDRIKNGKKPKAIIVAHLYGMPAKIEEIALIAEKYRIILIEDAAEALGASYKGKKCGTFGDFGILSFNNNKIVTTFGGGALLCKEEKHKNKAIFLATHSKDIAPHFQHSVIGYNYRMSEITAGIGIAQIKLLDRFLDERKLNNVFYKTLFKKIHGVSLLKEPNTNYFSSHWLSCIIINSKITGFTSEDLRLSLLEDNIESRPLWKPMHLQPVFKDCEYFGGHVAEELFNNGLCLPSGSNLLQNDLERIASSIKKFL